MRLVSQALASNASCRPVSRALAIVALTAAGLLGLAPSPASASTPGTWTLTGSMSTERDDPTAVLLPSGKVLIFGGTTCSASSCPTSASSAELYDPAAGTWSPTGSLLAPPYTNVLGGVLLQTGKVLAVGPFACPAPCVFTTAAELYDPATGVWTATGRPTQIFLGGFSTTLLANGQVLVAGGASANLYDPQTGTWSGTGAPIGGQHQHTAVLLANGQVLIAGGCCATAMAQLYSSTSGTWALTGSMGPARVFHAMALLPSGKVLVAGGGPGQGLTTFSSAEIYDPAAGTWSPTGSMAISRDLLTLTVLPDGTALAAGGNNFTGGDVGPAELYDPTTGTWSTTGRLNNNRIAASATLLPNGQVLVAGGLGTASAELYTPLGAIDVTPPTIAITSPTNTIYLLNHSVLANYSCTDSDSAVATCVGTVANGSPIDTASVGTKTFTVNATDPSGNASTQSVVYTVSFGICALYDQTKTVQSGSTVPIKVELCDASGADTSSSSVVVTATALTQISTGAPGAVEASGNSNPGNNFRFDPTLGTSGGYIFNFSTRGLSTGTYALSFTAGNDPIIHMVQFQVS